MGVLHADAARQAPTTAIAAVTMKKKSMKTEAQHEDLALGITRQRRNQKDTLTLEWSVDKLVSKKEAMSTTMAIITAEKSPTVHQAQVRREEGDMIVDAKTGTLAKISVRWVLEIPTLVVLQELMSVKEAIRSVMEESTTRRAFSSLQ